MEVSTSVLSSPRIQTKPVRSIARPNPMRPSETFQAEKRGSILSTCTADRVVRSVWAAFCSLCLLQWDWEELWTARPCRVCVCVLKFGDVKFALFLQRKKVCIDDAVTLTLLLSRARLALPQLTLVYTHTQIEAETQTMCSKNTMWMESAALK